MKDYYKEIDTSLDRLERGAYPTHDIHWVCNRIGWCWRFRKITTAQMAELTDRACAYMKIAKFLY